jgi:hypothetical protein
MAIEKKLVKTPREVIYSIIFFVQLLPDKEQIMVTMAIKKLKVEDGANEGSRSQVRGMMAWFVVGLLRFPVACWR